MYFTYRTKQCNQALHDGGRYISATTHRDIVENSKNLKNGTSRGDIIQVLIAKLPVHRQASDGNELTNGTTDLTARLVLMMEFGELKYGFTARQQLVYKSGSLSDILTRSSQSSSRQREINLEKAFNAQSLDFDCIAGIEI
ncbi:hypothetical protein OCU04_007610 [Sclerotinia nivalis]|uniref:Uncharacterized protein n=1 Tax=Sclerotinia nivalis TaxID=352851 RepID=A0A9X0AJ53_9HELO|nr:hypothetical protein OCU04_007610 [Sclerotinia nivalis]